MGIEPTSPAWEAGVIAIIRRPQNASFYRVLHRDGKAGDLCAGVKVYDVIAQDAPAGLTMLEWICLNCLMPSEPR